ncbi:MAG: SDR family oxidoreductase [Gammaproteobacteria bacterium]|nr:SDR family oxidoreductase [Gammaproteobacteria bacterium]
MSTLSGRTALVTGASRGIGLAIAQRLAEEGANVVIIAKDILDADGKSTLDGIVESIKANGGNALAVSTDIRNDDEIAAAIKQTVSAFGGIDICVNNASAIAMTSAVETTTERYDLMYMVNARSSFLCAKHAFEFMQDSTNPHVLNISPPLNLDSRWLAPHPAYTGSQYLKSMYTLGLSEDWKPYGIAVNSLWPRSMISTEENLDLSGNVSNKAKYARKPSIMADAAALIFTMSSNKYTGEYFIDEEVLAAHGVENFSKYAIDPSSELVDEQFV